MDSESPLRTWEQMTAVPCPPAGMCGMRSSYRIARSGNGFHVTYPIQAQKVGLDDTPAGKCFVLTLVCICIEDISKRPIWQQF